MQKTVTFLMFVGPQNGMAEEAIRFYMSLFKDSRIINVERYGPDDGEPEGNVKHAVFTLDGQEYMASDGGQGHDFTFTPAISIFVQCETEDEIDRLNGRLSEGGFVFMELDKYPFSDKFAWVGDKYGVTWQLNLASR